MLSSSLTSDKGVRQTKGTREIRLWSTTIVGRQTGVFMVKDQENVKCVFQRVCGVLDLAL